MPNGLPFGGNIFIDSALSANDNDDESIKMEKEITAEKYISFIS
jgi:hypothetical protein